MIYPTHPVAGNYPEPAVWSGCPFHLVCPTPFHALTPLSSHEFDCDASQVNAQFIKQSARALAPGGLFQMLTDDAGYAAAAVRELALGGASAVMTPANGRHFSVSHSHGCALFAVETLHFA